MKTTPWLRLIAYRERPSSAPVSPRVDTDADVRWRIGRRIVDQLRAAIATQMASVGYAANRPAARIDDRQPLGFEVTSTDALASSRTLAIALVGRTFSCKYGVMNADAVPGKNRWLEFAADQRALAVWDQGVCRRFDGIEPLATFLIAAMSTFDTGPRDA